MTSSNNFEIPLATNFKYLQISLDNFLSFELHIDTLTKTL